MCRVANRDRQRIACIFGRNRFGKSKNRSYHPLHLLLFGPSVPHYAHLHLERRVFGENDRSLRYRQQRDPADVRKFQSAFRINREKDFFDGCAIRTEFLEKISKTQGDIEETLFERIPR